MSLIGNMIKAEQYRKAGLEYLKKHPTAKVLNQTHCAQCNFCCHLRPPCLTKADLSNLAKRFQMTEKEFFSAYCVIDYLPGEPPTIYLRRQNQALWAGQELPSSQTFEFHSPCVFLLNDKCSMHETGAKPKMCSEHECWADKGANAQFNEFTKDELVALGARFDDEEYDE